jgi:hypothetical protein
VPSEPAVSNRGHTAIDREVHACDEACFVGRKEQGGRRDLLRAAEPPERDRRGELGAGLVRLLLGALPGGHAEGPPDALGEASDRSAVAAGATRPVFHQLEARIEAHVFIAFLAYCLHVTLARRLHALAPGLTPRSVLEKFAVMQMINVHLPTTDGRELVLTRYTEPEAELSLLLKKLSCPPNHPLKLPPRLCRRPPL